MIKLLFDAIAEELSCTEATCSRFMPTGPFLVTERNLLRGMPDKYEFSDKPVKDVEDDLAWMAKPNLDLAKQGIRRLKNLRLGLYGALKVLLGTTKLYVAEKATKRNLEAITVLYMGEARESGNPEFAGEYRSRNMAVVHMVDNSCISAFCLYGEGVPVAMTRDWYPEGTKGQEMTPYPASVADVSGTMQQGLRQLGMPRELIEIATDSKSYRALPDLVMLCVKAYHKVKSISN